MAEPAHEMSRELVNLLTRAADSGGPVSLAAMQEELGVGHDDLSVMLDQLREQGIAAEVAPGEWSQAVGTPAPAAERAQAESPDGRVTVTVPDASDGEPEIGSGVTFSPYVDPDVRLTRAIAEKLSDEALGQLVKAGLEDAGTDGPFLLEITP